MSDPMKSPDRDAADELAKPCTCHPDDNPPVPCAQKYALTDCLRSELATLRRRVDLAVEAFGKYGMHTNECSGNDDYGQTCNCGFDAAEAAFTAPLPPGRNEG